MIRSLIRRRQRGQGMVEYIIIVGLIAILLVGAVRRFSMTLDVTIQGTDDGIYRIDDGVPNSLAANGGATSYSKPGSPRKWTWDPKKGSFTLPHPPGGP